MTSGTADGRPYITLPEGNVIFTDAIAAIAPVPNIGGRDFGAEIFLQSGKSFMTSWAYSQVTLFVINREIFAR